MKLNLRKTTINDLNDIYDLHTKCFEQADQWYKNIIGQYLNNSYVITYTSDYECNDYFKTNTIIGVLLQGDIVASSLPEDNFASHFDHNMTMDIESAQYSQYNLANNHNQNNYQLDIFVPINEYGHLFLQQNNHTKAFFGIVMLCVDPKYRKFGLAMKLIKKHFETNTDKLLCLHTRKSNIPAYNLYRKMGYIQYAYIKNKYFFPTEDSIFMVKHA